MLANPIIKKTMARMRKRVAPLAGISFFFPSRHILFLSIFSVKYQNRHDSDEQQISAVSIFPYQLTLFIRQTFSHKRKREKHPLGYPLLVCGKKIYFSLVFLCTRANSFISLAFSRTASVISAPPRSLASSFRHASPSSG